MSIRKIDSKGRITIPKRDRERIGATRFLIVNAGDHLKLLPVPDNPLDALKGSLSIPKSFNEMRREAEKLATSEATKQSWDSRPLTRRKT
ncbi:hypothetical protein A3K78_10760 [Candidatus Bathyarchaeota archaeon RBG_13_52_12]|nr:MAG: hypothetical protein A3K78_10760 [Candidatus Bathyarchaeota archaeon RBG_13_52_12]